MTFTVEVLLKDRQYPVTEVVEHAGHEADGWTEDDVASVLTTMLRAVDRASGRELSAERAIALRGLSWIVSPYEGGVVIAVEIPSGAVVAGPFAIAGERLESLIGRALAIPSGSSSVH